MRTTSPKFDAYLLASIAWLCIAFVVWPWAACAVDLVAWLMLGHQMSHIPWTDPLTLIGLLFGWPMLTGTLIAAIAA